jgi:hypothetical protein
VLRAAEDFIVAHEECSLRTNDVALGPGTIALRETAADNKTAPNSALKSSNSKKHCTNPIRKNLNPTGCLRTKFNAL